MDAIIKSLVFSIDHQRTENRENFYKLTNELNCFVKVLTDVFLVRVVNFNLLVMHVRPLAEEVRASRRQVKDVLD